MAKPEDPKSNWADMEEDEQPDKSWAAEEPQYETIPQGHEAAPNVKRLPDGTKIVTEVISRDGGKFKVTKHLKSVQRTKKIFSAAEERQKRWKKFGKAAGGNDADLTVVCEPVRLELGKKEMTKNRMESEIQEMVKKVSTQAQTGDGIFTASKKAHTESTDAGPGAKKSTSYVAPGRGAGDTDGGRPPRDDSATVRITNLSEDISEDDLRGLFHKYGHITRSYIAVDRNTKERRGFGFITYKTRDEAAEAIKHLDRHPLRHVILEVGWAKPQRD